MGITQIKTLREYLKDLMRIFDFPKDPITFSDDDWGV